MLHRTFSLKLSHVISLPFTFRIWLTRPNPKGANILSIESGRGLSNSTMQQRITVLRLFCDSLIEQQLRQDNPVGRGHYVPGKAFGGVRDRGLLPHYHKLPWIPSDPSGKMCLRSLTRGAMRNQVLLLLAYDGALRREELVTLEISDFDFAYRQIRIRAEHAKNGRERVVGYGKVTSRLLEAYLQHRRTLSTSVVPSSCQSLIAIAQSPCSGDLVQDCSEDGATDRSPAIYDPYTTTSSPDPYGQEHMDLHQIALYAGHASLQTTMLYIHLSGVELTEAVTRSLASFEHWIEMILGRKS